MRITSPSLFGLAFATVAGGAYVVTGHRDFSVEVHRPLPEVYSAFSDIRNFGSGLRAEGIDVPKVTVTRPSDHELVFTAPSANPGQISRIAFTFEAQPGSLDTRVSAAIDVPPIVMGIDGNDKVLSEEKVEARFREAITEMGAQLDQGNAPTAARAKLALLLDVVALASNPDKARIAMTRIEHAQADVARVKQSYEREGWSVQTTGNGTGFEAQRHVEPIVEQGDTATPTTNLDNQ